MRYCLKSLILFLAVSLFTTLDTIGQTKADSISKEVTTISKKEKKKKKKKKKKVKLPSIDLSHWKVTLPVTNEKGKPYEIEAPEILDFASNDIAKPYMYIDSTRGAIVFHALPTDSKTANTKYTRSELREQMVPGDNSVNWTFEQGGIMKAKLAMSETSKDKNGKYHKTIVMQIHGRLTNDQKKLIGAKDNNAPPILKIYWDKGKVRVKTKVLKYLNTPYEGLLHEEAWDNDEGFTFEEEVGFGKFSLEVRASKGKLVVILNNSEYKVYENIHMTKWGIFENYFKAGNYFQSRDENSFSKVNFYELEVIH